jgi:hypothetical protein
MTVVGGHENFYAILLAVLKYVYIKIYEIQGTEYSKENLKYEINL